MKMSIRSCRAVRRGLILALAGWLSFGTLIFAVDVVAPSSSESDTLGKVWKQLIAARAEVATLRQAAAEQARDPATVQNLKRQLENTSISLTRAGQQLGTAETEKNRLQEQVLTLQQRAAPLPALEAQAQRLQTVGTKALMLETQVETQLERNAAQQMLESQVKALTQEKADLVKTLAGAEAHTRQDLAAQQEGFAAKEEALAKAEQQIQRNNRSNSSSQSPKKQPPGSPRSNSNRLNQKRRPRRLQPDCRRV